ncbi:FAD-dependent thymidylate synthase [Tumidithrix elongata RA019]|uniref:FAD-dependent thymidylate synthase n=1 Tax=Tumidithrix elongata BACA0141 TaxID=2716417 RepID=A0AAW9PQI4_9CYAN|nr:FAD-dependent thymidylate synthase [Tumidithrix elongata RA019]
MTESWETTLTEQASSLLQPFVTNTDKPVFCLRNLPEVVKGALFSRYSRTDKSLRRILLDEFIHADESSFDRIVGGIGEKNNDQLVAIQQAEAFYERVLIGYGDDSVAELGGAHIACEGISNIAAKAIEDSRLGISPLEKSTRYVPFNRKVNDRYRYYREPSIMASPHAERYEATLDHLFDTYTALIDPLVVWVKSCTPKDEATSERAYNSATRAKALDLLRGLLPMATLTNVGLFGNGRSFEYLLTKMSASPHGEVRQLGSAMQQELDCVIPSFVKRSKTERGAKYAHYLSTNRQQIAQLAQKLPKQAEIAGSSTVQLVEYDPEAEVKTVAAILYPHTDLTLAQVNEYVANLSATERIEIIHGYVGDRSSRFHRPGRAFEETYYTFDLLADLGSYRDLHRHRVLTQERQDYTVRHGYIVPPELEEAQLAEPYRKALEYAAETTELIRASLPEAAQYVVPLAFRVRWRIRLNLREAYHLIELRSARQGHSTYRTVAQEMYRQILAVHPTLVANMNFVDLNDYDLERLASEQRLDAKLKQNQQ